MHVKPRPEKLTFKQPEKTLFNKQGDYYFLTF